MALNIFPSSFSFTSNSQVPSDILYFVLQVHHNYFFIFFIELEGWTRLCCCNKQPPNLRGLGKTQSIFSLMLHVHQELMGVLFFTATQRPKLTEQPHLKLLALFPKGKGALDSLEDWTQ